MALVGRKREMSILDQCMESGRAEFVALYGRRRVGKTFLVREYFKGGFAFSATGVANDRTSEQLRTFGLTLQEYGSPETTPPSDWYEAFMRLRRLLSSTSVQRDALTGRRVVFLDELPWFDTARSNFKTALEWFWNSWASGEADIMLVVCGSATSWIIENLLEDHGGLYNRVTRQIQLLPFTLAESEALLRANDVHFDRQQVIESYMVFGGIPHYLNMMSRRASLAQNIEALCFADGGELRFEFNHLFASLFKNGAQHEAVIRALARRSSGTTRAELLEVSGIEGGKSLTRVLRELVECGFVRKYRNYAKAKNGAYYQVIDPFTLFSLRFLDSDRVGSWERYVGTPGYYAWTGTAFELVCLWHVSAMKRSLGISGVASDESTWRSRESRPGAQVDLLIDRADGIINLCEMKYSASEYVIDAQAERDLRRKMDVFAREANPKKALHLTLVTPHGAVRNSHYGAVTNEIAADAFFE